MVKCCLFQDIWVAEADQIAQRGRWSTLGGVHAIDAIELCGSKRGLVRLRQMVIPMYFG